MSQKRDRYVLFMLIAGAILGDVLAGCGERPAGPLGRVCDLATDAYPSVVAFDVDGLIAYAGHATADLMIFDVATQNEIRHYKLPDLVDDEALLLSADGARLFVKMGRPWDLQDLAIITLRR